MVSVLSDRFHTLKRTRRGDLDSFVSVIHRRRIEPLPLTYGRVIILMEGKHDNLNYPIINVMKMNTSCGTMIDSERQPTEKPAGQKPLPLLPSSKMVSTH